MINSVYRCTLSDNTAVDVMAPLLISRQSAQVFSQDPNQCHTHVACQGLWGGKWMANIFRKQVPPRGILVARHAGDTAGTHSHTSFREKVAVGLRVQTDHPFDLTLNP